MKLTEFLHRHVFLRPREGGGQGLVERVLQHCGGLVGWRVGDHHVVEGPLHVQHHGVEAAAVGRLQTRHRSWVVAEFTNAERLGQAAGRIDSEHHHLAAGLGGPYGERG